MLLINLVIILTKLRCNLTSITRLLLSTPLGLVSVWSVKKTKPNKFSKLIGRSGEIRTPDPLVPNQMRYQAALHSDVNSFKHQFYRLFKYFISLNL